MKNAPTQDERIANMTLASIFPHYVNKVEKKGRTTSELLQVIEWLTSYNESQINAAIKANETFKIFFEKAKLNPKAHLITGSICGHKIQEIKNPLTKKVRFLDKLIDELAQGKSMEKISRK